MTGVVGDSPPVGFPSCVGSISGKSFLGTLGTAPDGLSFAVRGDQIGGCADVTRKLSVELKPGDSWQLRDEPGLVVFVGEGNTGEALFREAHRLRPLIESPKPTGKIVY